MNKPQMKREVAVDLYYGGAWIVFYSTRDALADVQPFGQVTAYTDIPDKYVLRVDTRFDFSEVLDYMENYGKDGD